MTKLKDHAGPSKSALLTTGLVVSLLAFSTVGASATIACSGDVCWRVHTRLVYPLAPTIVIHPDYWRPPTPRIVVHERWRPVERFTREYVVRDFDDYGDLDW